MKLIGLQVAGIRGFNDEISIDLDGSLVIYYGPNGSGKTSIGEAIEWLFFGKTLKRVKGDEISKREYEGNYRNSHYSKPTKPFRRVAHYRQGRDPSHDTTRVEPRRNLSADS